MSKDYVLCPACKAPFTQNDKGVFCFGRGHSIFVSWEYINNPVYYWDHEIQVNTSKYKLTKQIELF